MKTENFSYKFCGALTKLLARMTCKFPHKLLAIFLTVILIIFNSYSYEMGVGSISREIYEELRAVFW